MQITPDLATESSDPETPLPPTRRARERAVLASIGWALLTAVWVPAAALAVAAALAGIAYLVFGDGGTDSMIGILYIGILYLGTIAFYVVWSLVALAKAPPGRGVAALVGVVLPPLLLFGGGWMSEQIKGRRYDEARVVIDTIEDIDHIDGYGPVIKQYLGRTIDGDRSLFRCADGPVWQSALGGGTNAGLADELEAVNKGAELLRANGFEVTTATAIRPDTRDPDRVGRASLIALGIRDNDAVVFFAELYRDDRFESEFFSWRSGVQSVRDECLDQSGLEQLTFDEFELAPRRGPLPTELPGLSDVSVG